jgi:hypothetical protein
MGGHAAFAYFRRGAFLVGIVGVDVELLFALYQVFFEEWVGEVFLFLPVLLFGLLGFEGVQGDGSAAGGWK